MLALDVVGLVLIWLFAGSLIWMLRDPHSITENVTHTWLDSHGRLPPRGAVIAAHVVAIVAWPL